MPTPTAEPSCPEATAGTQLLTREEMGYCLLYLEGFIEVDTEPAQVCLVPGEPYMVCHSANAFINVEDAAGRTANQVADEMITDEEAAIPGIEIQRTDIKISGEQAVVLEGMSGVASTRYVVIVHADRLYSLVFVPWDESGEDYARIEHLYNTVINSFTFVPIVPSPKSTEVSQGSGGGRVG